MKPRFSLVLAGVATLFASVSVAPFVLPASIYKEQIEHGVTRATGRAFVIKGPLHFALFPNLAIRADMVSLANVPGGRGALFTADDVRFGVKLWPLFFRRVEITQVVLEHPTLNLEVDAQGRANWILRSVQRSGGGKSSPTSAMTEQFSRIEIAQGRLTYTNLHARSEHSIYAVDAVVDLTQLDRPASVAGAFTLADHRIAFKATAATPQLLLQERVAAIDLSLKSDLIQAGFKGTIAPNGSLIGNATAMTASLHATADWLGIRLPGSGGFGPFSFNGRIAYDNSYFRLAGATIEIDGATAKGDMSVDTRPAVPYANGTLAIDRLDLTPYTERRHKQGVAHVHHDSDAWSEEPIVFDALKKVNADITLEVGALTLRKLQLGKTRIAAAVKNAQLTAKLDPVTLYGGTGRAELTVDAREMPRFRNTVEFDHVSLQPFLSSTIGVKQIEGTGTIKLDVRSKGDSAATIMRKIEGKGSIDFHDGQVRGVDLGRVAKTVQSLLGGAIQSGAFTRYSTMSGTFAATNGVLTSNDFQLTGPILHMTGTGSVDVGQRSLDFRLMPQTTAVIAKQKLSIGIPFHIKGPWKHVHYTADVAGLVNGVLDNLSSGRAPFKGLFGSGAPNDPHAPKKKHKNIGDALKNMFGIH
jgi:AsmA protein